MGHYVDMQLQMLNAIALPHRLAKGWVAGIGMALGRFLSRTYRKAMTSSSGRTSRGGRALPRQAGEHRAWNES